MPEVSHTPRAFFCTYAGTTPINNLQALPSDLAASASYSPTPRNKQQGLRRSLGIYRGIGAGCAALSAFVATSAQVAPLSKHLPRHRRRLRRSLGICCGVGAGCAALLAFAAADREKCAGRWVAERDCLRRTHVINHRSLTAHPRAGVEKADCEVWKICK